MVSLLFIRIRIRIRLTQDSRLAGDLDRKPMSSQLSVSVCLVWFALLCLYLSVAILLGSSFLRQAKLGIELEPSQYQSPKRPIEASN